MGRKILIVVLCLVIVACGIYIGLYVYDRSVSDSNVQELLDLKVTPTPAPATPTPASATPTPTAQITPEPEPTIMPEYQALFERNNDLFGWVKIEGTNIDYPVLYREDDFEFYYLERNYDGEEDKAGMIFLDGRCRIDPLSTNLIMHGHNMKNGSMFHNLRYYKKKSYFEEHQIIQLDTLYAKGYYQIIAFVESKVFKEEEEGFRYYSFIEGGTKEEFDEYIAGVKKIASYDTGHSAEFGDQLITLSTCDYVSGVEQPRMALIAKYIGDTLPDEAVE